MNALEAFLPLLDRALWHGFVVFLRLAAVAALIPAFGEQFVPVRVKLVLSIAFALIVAPALEVSPAPQNLTQAIQAMMTETLSGVILGIGLRLFILALQTAGAIAAQSTSLSQVLGGAAVDPLPAMGYILVISGMTLAVMTGLHVKAAQLAILSYDFLPYGQFPQANFVTAWGTEQVARAFSLAFTLAAPFVLLSALYNFALGAINRAMPQLMVAFVGAPLITAGGLMILFLAAPHMLTVWLETLDSFVSNPMEKTR